MIYLHEVAQKLENILNGVDDETSSLIRPNDFYFKVETVGFHLDHIKAKQVGKNFIPVFVSSLGGEFDPVKNIKRQNYSVSIAFYFPVRFKEQFFAMQDFLFDCFVGQYRNFGVISGKCLSNISPAEYGDIRDLDLRQYKEWVSSIYKEEIDIMEKWMTMEVKLYLSSAAEGYSFANAIDYKLKFDVERYSPAIKWDNQWYERDVEKDREYQGTTYYAWTREKKTSDEFTYWTVEETLPFTNPRVYVFVLDIPVEQERSVTSQNYEENHLFIDSYNEKIEWTQGGSGVNNSPIAQQLIDQESSYATNVINVTNYEKSIVAYFKTSPMWLKLLDLYNTNQFDKISGLKLVKTYNFGDITKSYEFNQVVIALNENDTLGSLISFTIAFGDRKVE